MSTLVAIDLNNGAPAAPVAPLNFFDAPGAANSSASSGYAAVAADDGSTVFVISAVNAANKPFVQAWKYAAAGGALTRAWTWTGANNVTGITAPLLTPGSDGATAAVVVGLTLGANQYATANLSAALLGFNVYDARETVPAPAWSITGGAPGAVS